MGRAVTKNAQGELEVTETFNFATAEPTLSSVKLIAKDGSPVDTENPSWLDFNQSISGSTLEVTLQIDVSGVEPYTTYTFEVVTTGDSGNEKGRRVNVGIGSLDTDFRFTTVVAQEDRFRRENGQRINNGGTALVFVETTMESDIRKVELKQNPSDEDNPNLDEEIKEPSSEKAEHQFSFGVSPDSLYAYKVFAEASFDNSVSDLVSGVRYFETGDQISQRDPSENLTANTEIEKIDPGSGASVDAPVGSLETANFLNTVVNTPPAENLSVSRTYEKVALAATINRDTDPNNFATITSYQTV
jgi:hypothetical protein